MRRNPPLSEDQFSDPQPRGGECFVFSVATATGQSVETVRRTMIQHGIDIWNDAGFTRGISDKEEMAKVISLLDTRKRVFSMAVVAPPQYGYGGAPQTKYQYLGPGFAAIRGWLSKEGLDIGFSTYHRPLTVSRLIGIAKKSGNAMIAVLANRATVRKKYEKIDGVKHLVGRTIRGSTHAVAFSPSKGFIDIAMQSLGSRAAFEKRRYLAEQGIDPGDATREEIEFFSHGDVFIPAPKRLALAWIFFRGE